MGKEFPRYEPCPHCKGEGKVYVGNCFDDLLLKHAEQLENWVDAQMEKIKDKLPQVKP